MQDRLIGVLDLESAETHAFTAEHERMLATLASYVSHRPRKRAPLRRSPRKRAPPPRRPRHLRAKFSASFFPAAFAKFPASIWPPVTAPRANWVPTSTIFFLWEGRLAVALGDVSAKGLRPRCLARSRSARAFSIASISAGGQGCSTTCSRMVPIASEPNSAAAVLCRRRRPVATASRPSHREENRRKSATQFGASNGGQIEAGNFATPLGRSWR